MPYYTTSQGIHLYYKEHKGKKQTLLFIHGWPLNHSMWNASFSFFAKQEYHVISVDIRGHGRSDIPKDAYHITDFENDIKEILTQCKAKQVIIIGHSFGGMIALSYAQHNPCTKLIMIDSTYRNPFDDMQTTTKQLLHPFTSLFTHLSKKLDKTILKHHINLANLHQHSDVYIWLQAMLHTNTYVVAQCLQEMMYTHLSYQHITIPTLLMVGQKDKFTPTHIDTYVQKKIAHAQLVILKDAHHQTPIQQSKQINKHILTFLTS
ncbi:MAG: alpha/beta fold hydrolase [Candidatus Woesearchaeota archaeon]